MKLVNVPLTGSGLEGFANVLAQKVPDDYRADNRTDWEQEERWYSQRKGQPSSPACQPHKADSSREHKSAED